MSPRCSGPTPAGPTASSRTPATPRTRPSCRPSWRAASGPAPPPRADMDALRELLWPSGALLVARVDGAGDVVEANDALRAWAQRDVRGSRFAELVSPPQRAAVERALDAAADTWSTLTVGLDDGSGRPAQDRTLRLRRDGDAVMAVAEPQLIEAEELVREVLELNDDLIDAQ